MVKKKKQKKKYDREIVDGIVGYIGMLFRERIKNNKLNVSSKDAR